MSMPKHKRAKTPATGDTASTCRFALRQSMRIVGQFGAGDAQIVRRGNTMLGCAVLAGSQPSVWRAARASDSLISQVYLRGLSCRADTPVSGRCADKCTVTPTTK